MITFDPEHLRIQLSRFNHLQMVGFAVACAARTLPNYKMFQQASGWGDSKPLEMTIEGLWKSASQGFLEHDHFSDLLALCRDQVPDLDEVDSEYATYGFDAALSILAALLCAQTGLVQHAIHAAQHAYDTVDTWVQVQANLDPNRPDLEQRIAESPLMMRELEYQRAALRLLDSMPQVGLKAVDELQAAWGDMARGNIEPA